MFFGSIVKPGAKTPLPTDCGTIFHLSQACLTPTTNTKTFLQINTPNNDTVNLCSLKKDQCEHATFDLFVPAGDPEIFFTVKGDNEVHIAGYFEPDGEPELDMDDSDIEEGEESETEAANEAKNDELMKEIAKMPGKKFASVMPSTAEKKGKKLAASLNKSAGQSTDVTDESDDENINMEEVAKLLGKQQGAEESDDSGADSDLDGSEDDDDDDDDDDEIDAEEIAKAIEKARKASKAAPKKSEAPAAVGKLGGAKRKPEVPAQNVAAKKKAKKESDSGPSAAASSGGGEEDKYQKSLVEYLKAHGKTLISQLGGAVKRPQSVKKLGAFVKERESVFNIQGAFVSLK